MNYFVLIFAGAAAFIIAEHSFPGRALSKRPGWYLRTAFLNACQLGVVLLSGVAWIDWSGGVSVLSIATRVPPVVEGFIAWFIGTFVFYWWHRLRHESDLCWLVFHQIHHSPMRIETLTSFYKHPVEMCANAIITSAILYLLLGASVEAAGWYNVFAALGEMFYHSNLKTPHWVGYFLQRPEHHAIHHELDVHRYNYGDITWWDRLFGTFKEADDFARVCGFPNGNERRLGAMLVFRDVYQD